MSTRPLSILLSDREVRRITDVQAAVSLQPRVSMNRSARYVTQQGIYEGFFTGKLTNRRIAYYQKMGYYGNPVVATTHQDKQRTKVKRARKLDAFITF